MKRKVLGGICSLAVVNSILFDDSISSAQKQKALELAKKSAAEDGRHRIWVEDWEWALKKIKDG